MRQATPGAQEGLCRESHAAPDATADQWLELIDAIEAAPIISEFDQVRTERAHNPRLLERIESEGVIIYAENDPV